ncbi:CBS domain-containing protein [Sandaracinus amylolyticus]|uniref:CBS domain-containing protein n=1 Tax=Sandaracinus amylolyticus TaxID=927083 RepID=UPI001F3E53D0|nr:CBS domain-containing protein [Sandaracinus amylolyticus]UJR82104.1 Inosine-5-monophosphate dehydrogenase [Sandaracinus amylolyticus]
MRVEEVMSTPVRAIAPDDTLHDATREMWRHGCGALAVIDGRDRVVGMLTDRDVCLAAFIQEDRLDALRVESAMTPVVYCCRVGESLRHAEEAMRDHHVRRLPVLDAADRLVGMLSIDDLAVAAALRQWGGDDALASVEIAGTFASVAAPRAMDLQSRALAEE